MRHIITSLFVAFYLMGATLMPAQANTPNAASILMLSAGHVNQAKSKLIGKIAKDQGVDLQQKKLESYPAQTDWAMVFSQYDLVLLDGVSVGQTKRGFGFLQGKLAAVKPNVKISTLMWPEGRGLHKDVSLDQSTKLKDYYYNGGRKNFERLFTYIRSEFFAENVAVEPAIIYPKQGVYHPQSDEIFETPQAYLNWYKEQYPQNSDAPIVGIIVQRASIASEDLLVIDDMIDRLAKAGAIAMPFYYANGDSVSQMADWLMKDGQSVADSLINARIIHWADEHRELFTKLGVSVVNTVRDKRSEQEWRADNGGIPGSGIPFYITIPEMAGMVDPLVIGAIDKEDGRYHPIAEQVDQTVRKAVRLANLAHKPNKDKKVALFYYNYPPGERSAQSSFLNVPTSVESISSLMKKEGYNNYVIKEQLMIDAIANLQRPLYREESPKTIYDKGFGKTLSVADYKAWFQTLPETVQQQVNDYWGQPDDHFMVTDIDGQKQFVIPMMNSGNLMVLPQPPRGDKNDKEKTLYHNKAIPVNHFYLAVYYYVRKNFAADAIIHLGTHGTHEWLPGKERGLWAFDPGILTADDVPIIYPYIVDDVGEALQAKRRGRATMISHMTPPFAPSGLYRELTEVHELIHHYQQVDPGQVREKNKEQLISKVKKLNIPKDLGWTAEGMEQRFDEFLVVLHDYLHELALENQPLGLHTFGKLPVDRLMTTTVMQILGKDYLTDVYTYLGFDEEEVDHGHGELGKDGLFGEETQLENIIGFKELHDVLIKQQPIPQDASDELRAHLERAVEIGQRMKGILELKSMVLALNGRFIEPSTGGDPVRNDETLPTGRNLYGFDPSRLPTQAAWETGKQLVTDLINEYYTKHGRYPDKLAFSLWSMEAMRHHGVLEAQAMYALGVKPKWADSGRVVGTEIIPFSDLKRPRVDVVLSATGLYRDAFPGVMKLLAEAIDEVARLKEEGNNVYLNAQKIAKTLEADGVNPKEADYLSTVRIFSAQSGTYGSGLGDTVLATDTWENDSKLAGLYMDRMGYAFGKDPKRWNEKNEAAQLYAKNLSGTDVALFSRSSNVFGMLASDDPFQYLGGLSLAVRNLDGKSPEMAISNLRDPNQGKMESLNSFMSKELRTRYFHPRWVKAMQDEGYAGALNIIDTINNFTGWQVVDPQNVRADQWQEFFEVYVNDKLELDMKEWFEKSNPEALAQIAERMLEVIRKDYWKPNDETMKKLVETYQEMQAKYDVVSDNEKFKDYVEQLAKGYGLSKPDVTPVELPTINIPQPSANPAAEQVEGQKLAKVEQTTEIEDDMTKYYLFALILAFFLAGVVWQQVAPRYFRRSMLSFSD
ncbi:MAG: cobaltochelatase subunit CobN [Methylocystaceae bacterium]|nr:cobaltochelatase subunit CobN [Methylocystaceae bacterium]